MPRLPAFFREPLAHFALVGVVLFGADRLLSPAEPTPATEPRVIRLSVEMQRELTENFRHRQGREPSPDELERVRERWLEDEVLYREGVALGLAADDVLIKNRVVEKMRFVLSNGAPVRQPTDGELRAFWQERRADYDRPRRYDFEHVAVSGATAGEQRANAEQLVRQLSAGLAPESLGPAHRLFEGRSAENVAALFGPSVEARLGALPRDGWHVVEGDPSRPSASRDATQPASTTPAAAPELHLFRVSSVENATPPDFDALRPELSADWQRRERQVSTQQRLKQLRERYGVQEGGA
jgi:parvulin-like peptidyl-prolyl cis-trans isomerase-like protein